MPSPFPFAQPSPSNLAQTRRRRAGVILPERRDPYAEEMARLAEEQKAQATAQKAAEKAAEEQAREAEKAQAAAQKAALAEENNAKEQQFRREGRPMYMDAGGRIQSEVTDDEWNARQAQKVKNDQLRTRYYKEKRPFMQDAQGNIVPQHSDEEWQALNTEKAAKLEAAKVEKANQQLRQDRRQEVDGVQRNLSDSREGVAMRTQELELQHSEAAAQAKKRADFIKQTQDQLENSLDIPAARAASMEQAVTQAQKELEKWQAKADALDGEVRSQKAAELAFRKAQQPIESAMAAAEDAIPSLTVETGAPMGVSSPPNPGGVPVKKDAPQVPGVRDAVIDRQQDAVASDPNLKPAERKAALEDLAARRDPVAYAALKRKRLAEADVPTLKSALDTEGPALESRIQDHQKRRAALEQQVSGAQQAVQTVLARNQTRLQQPHKGADLVTVDGPDGQPVSVFADLVDDYNAAVSAWQEQSKALQAEADVLHTEAAEIQLDQQLYNEGVQALNQKQEAEQQRQKAAWKAERVKTYDRFNQLPGGKKLGDRLKYIDDVLEQHSGGDTELDAWAQDETAKIEAEAERQQKLRVADKQSADVVAARVMDAVEKYRQSGPQGAFGAQFRLSDKEWQAASRDVEFETNNIKAAELKRAGFDPDNAEHRALLEDALNRADMSKPLDVSATEKIKQVTPDMVRVMSDGELVINPQLVHLPDRYLEVVNASEASKEEKLKALNSLPDRQRAHAESLLPTLKQEMNIPGLPSFTKWQAEKKRSGDEIDQAQDYLAEMAERGFWSKFVDTVGRNAVAGLLIDAPSMVVGAAGGLTGSETLSRAAADQATYGNQIVTGALDAKGGQSNGVTNVIAQTARMAGPVAAQIVVTRGLGGGMGTITTGAGVQTAGIQYAQTYGALREQGKTHAEAWKQAAPAALASGIVTALLTKAGGNTGVERLMTRARPAAQAAANSVWQRWKNAVGAVGKQALAEIPEELPDELFSQLSEEVATHGADADMEGIITQFFKDSPTLIGSIALMGGAGGLRDARAALRAPAVPAAAPSAVPSAAPETPTPAKGETTNVPPPATPVEPPDRYMAARAAVAAWDGGKLPPERAAVTKAKAEVLIKIAEGAKPSDLEQEELMAVGLRRQDDGRITSGYITNKGDWKKGVRPDGFTSVELLNDQFIITDRQAKRLREVGMDAVADAIALPAAERRKEIMGGEAAPEPAAKADTPAQAAVNKPVAASEDTIPMEWAADKPDNQTLRQGEEEKSAAPSLPVSESPSLVSPESKQRAAEIATVIEKSGVPREVVLDVASKAVEASGIDPDGYASQMMQPAFDAAMKAQGWVRKPSNPLRWERAELNQARIGAEMDAQKARMTKAEVVRKPDKETGRQADGETKPVAKVELSARQDWRQAREAGLRQQMQKLEKMDKAKAKEEFTKITRADKVLVDLVDNRYGALFDEVRMGRNEAGFSALPLATDEKGRATKVALVIDPANFYAHGGLAPLEIEAALEEELAHRVDMMVSSRREAIDLARAIHKARPGVFDRVWQDYFAVSIREGSLPSKPPAVLTEEQAYLLYFEATRMIHQGTLTTETIQDVGTLRQIWRYLQSWLKHVRREMRKLPRELLGEWNARIEAAEKLLKKLERRAVALEKAALDDVEPPEASQTRRQGDKEKRRGSDPDLDAEIQAAWESEQKSRRHVPTFTPTQQVLRNLRGLKDPDNDEVNIVSRIDMEGGIAIFSDKVRKQRLQNGLAVGGELDWLEKAGLPPFWKGLIFRKGNAQNIDTVMQQLHDEGYFPEAADESDVTGEMLAAKIADVLDRYQALKEGRGDLADADEQYGAEMAALERQRVAFERATADGPLAVRPADLKPGDVMQVKGEDGKLHPVEVLSLDTRPLESGEDYDPEGNPGHRMGPDGPEVIESVTLKDGTTFGVQTVDGQEGLYVDEFKVSRGLGSARKRTDPEFDARLQSLYEQYAEEESLDLGDLVEALDVLAVETTDERGLDLGDAVRDYQDAIRENHEMWGGRGDDDADRDRFLAAVRGIMQRGALGSARKRGAAGPSMFGEAFDLLSGDKGTRGLFEAPGGMPRLGDKETRGQGDTPSAAVTPKPPDVAGRPTFEQVTDEIVRQTPHKRGMSVDDYIDDNTERTYPPKDTVFMVNGKPYKWTINHGTKLKGHSMAFSNPWLSVFQGDRHLIKIPFSSELTRSHIRKAVRVIRDDAYPEISPSPSPQVSASPAGFTLESVTGAQLDAEAQRKKQREEMQSRQDKPLVGTQGDIGQMDMLGGGDLFAQPVKRDDTPRQDAPATPGTVEPDRPRNVAGDTGRPRGVQRAPGQPAGDAGRLGTDRAARQDAPVGGDAAAGGAAPAAGSGSAEPVQAEAPRVPERPAGGEQPRGSSGIDDTRAAVESGAELDLSPIAPDRPRRDEVADERRETPRERQLSQVQVDNTPSIWDGFKVADEASIAKSLPMLLPQQQQDVLKAERRFFVQSATAEDPKKGMLFTNGTGTGKTFTGLGIIKRFQMMGKGRVLIVVPNQQKVADWKAEGERVMVRVNPLKDTQDIGEDVVATTYANMRENWRLQSEPWDLVVYDESHYLGSNAQGEQTANIAAHELVTAKPGWHVMKKWVQAEIGPPPPWDDKVAVQRYENEAEQAWKRIQYRADTAPDTKAVFLSATPFAYHKSLTYADGFLFQTPAHTGSSAYNTPQGFDRYLVENFGYRMKTNRLNSPPPEVDQGLMEREWAERMFQNGAMSGRMIDVPFDYSREFVLLDSQIGQMLDDGFASLSGWGPENRDRATSDKFRKLHDAFQNYWYRDSSGYTKRMQFLESIKVGDALERMDEHLALGRKIVLFHSYNNADPVHPFQLGYLDGDAEVRQLAQDWMAAHPALVQMNFKRLQNPRQLVQQQFGDRVRFFNGEVSKKDRSAAIKAFNDDASGVDILMVQSDAGKEGISLHDTTGGKQRVLMNAGLPIKPTDAIQTEGRIYRIGVKTNAIQEYLVIHTSMERSAFGSKISTRTGTVENMALGKMARTLTDSFKSGYLNAHSEAPSAEQGLGGKKQDAAELLGSDMDRAKSYYFGRQKKTSKNKAAEGQDYFATPEPVGLTMVRFLNAKAGDDLLEPSAGHGAIGRFFPDFTANKFVEPSKVLSDELRIKVASGKVEVMPFEDLHVGANKFDGIAMNPPFGTAGKLAMEHVAKAAQHLRQGGRLVAIIPEGPAMQKRFDQWLENEGRDMHLRASYGLPTVTFERAGTSVKTRIVVLDKADLWTIKKEGDYAYFAVDSFGEKRTARQGDASSARSLANRYPGFIGWSDQTTIQNRSPRELSADTINELFDQLEGLEPPARITKNTATGEVSATPLAPAPSNPPTVTSRPPSPLAAFLQGGRGAVIPPAAEQAAAAAPAPARVAPPTPPAGMPEASKPLYATDQTLHAKRGTMTYVAKMNRRISDAAFNAERTRAKKHGGYWSSFKGLGAIPGFQFPSAEARDKFVTEGSQQALGAARKRGDTPPAAPFYSKLAQVIEAKMPNRADAKTIWGLITNPQTGIKQEELKWSGILPWLEAQSQTLRQGDGETGRLSKQAVLDYLASDGAVVLEEVRRGGIADAEAFAAQQRKVTAANQALIDFLVQKREFDERGAREYALDAARGDLSEPQWRFVNGDPEQKTLVNNLRDAYAARAETPQTRFDKYQLPGGENYREVVLAMPPSEKPDRKAPIGPEDQGRMWADANGVNWETLPESERRDILDELNETAEEETGTDLNDQTVTVSDNYRSSHFPDVTNYVAHLRLNDREDAEGRPGTFIEEIQSDRHQAGREKGYREDESENVRKRKEQLSELTSVLGSWERAHRDHEVLLERAAAAPPQFQERWNQIVAESSTKTLELDQRVRAFGLEPPTSDRWEWINRVIERGLPEVSANAIPDAPFRKDWPLQMFKRALADAVAAGKQWIGWTTGDTQAERYDLSKQVDHLIYHDDESLEVYGKDGDKVFARQVPVSALADHIGKEAAEKLMALEPNTDGERHLTNADLKVGGEGMKGFYDTILPKEIGKYVKQWGAGVVKGEVTASKPLRADAQGLWMVEGTDERFTSRAKALAAQPKTTPIWRVDITPAMRAGVEAGQALFAGRKRGGARVAEDYDGPVHVVRQNKVERGQKTGQFDEYKVMLGYPTAEEAREAYLRNYEPGWPGLHKLSTHSPAEFQKIKQTIFTVPADRVPGVREADAALASGVKRSSSPIAPDYSRVPDSLMGFRQNGPNRGFDEEQYPHTQWVKLTWSDGTTSEDAIKGMNRGHALERARRNWASAVKIEPIEPLSAAPKRRDNPAASPGMIPPAATAEDFARPDNALLRGMSNADWNRLDKGIKKRLDRILEPIVRYAGAKGDAAVEKMLDWVVGESLEGLEHAAGTTLEDVQQRKAAREALKAQARRAWQKTVRQVMPDATVPADVLAKMREMRAAESLSQEKALDVSKRALEGKTKLLDIMAGTKAEEFKSPDVRRKMYLAMNAKINSGVTMDDLTPEQRAVALALKRAWWENGMRRVRNGTLKLETFQDMAEGLPQYYEDDVNLEKGFIPRAFKMGLKGLIAQRSTRFHIVDKTSKDKSGEFALVNWTDPSTKRTDWKYKSKAHMDAAYEQIIEDQILAAKDARAADYGKLAPDDIRTLRQYTWMTDADRAALAGVTREKLRQPASLTTEQKAVVDRMTEQLHRRFQKKVPLTYQQHEKAGLIQDPFYSIGRALLESGHDNATAEFFNYIAKQPDYVRDVAENGFTAMPDDPKMGRLAGKWVRDDVAAELEQMLDVPNMVMRFYDALLAGFKYGHTILNFGSHVRNILGNVSFAALAGSNPLNPGNAKAYAEANKLLRDGGPTFEALHKLGILGGDYLTNEVRRALRQLLPDPDTVERMIAAQDMSWLTGLKEQMARKFEKTGSVLAKIPRGMENAWKWEDDIYKVAAFIKARQQGLSEADAAAHVRKWFPFYDKGTSGTLKALGRFVFPFLSFKRESLRIMGHALRERPLAFLTMMAIPRLLTQLSFTILELQLIAGMAGLGDDDEEDLLKDMKGKAGGLLAPFTDASLFSIALPWRDANGGMAQWDLSAVIPWSDWLSTRIEYGAEKPWFQRVASQIVSGAPFASLLVETWANQDTFSGRRIWEDDMSGTEKAGRLAEHVYMKLAPPMIGPHVAAMKRSLEQQPSKLLPARNPTQALMRILGIDIKPLAPDLYRKAEEYRKAKGAPVSPRGGQAFPQDAASRARARLYMELIQPEIDVQAADEAFAALDALGEPVRTLKDLSDLFKDRSPETIMPAKMRPGFVQSLPPESRRVYDSARTQQGEAFTRSKTVLQQRAEARRKAAGVK